MRKFPIRQLVSLSFYVARLFLFDALPSSAHAQSSLAGSLLQITVETPFQQKNDDQISVGCFQGRS